MENKIQALLAEAQAKIAAVKGEIELQQIKGSILGKQGSFTDLMKEIPKLDVSLRPQMGKLINEAKEKITALIEEKRTALKLKAAEVNPDFDWTVPGTAPAEGGLHPITQM